MQKMFAFIFQSQHQKVITNKELCQLSWDGENNLLNEKDQNTKRDQLIFRESFNNRRIQEAMLFWNAILVGSETILKMSHI